MKDKILNLFKVLSQSKVIEILKMHKIIALITAAVIALTAITSVAIISNTNKSKEEETVGSSSTQASSEESSELNSEPQVSEEVSSQVSSSEVESVVSSKPATSKPVTSKPVVSKPVATTPPTNTNFKYNTNTDIDDNVFMDSLIYTGYNIKKHRADGLMWQYVLASQKRGKGWLSNIGYAGGSSGYETVNGKPDIKAFERKGLVCASYVTYVYFNYLPNVAGIDTSSLTKPVKSYSAHDWYIAAKDWIKKGYSKSVSFTASKTSSGFIKFKLSEDIPIGSIMVFRDARRNSDHGSHVCIFAGYKNGYHWVYHVGNDNGPEFCAVERMHFGPDPQWPLMVITTPSNIRMAAKLEVQIKDETGAAVKGATVSIKNTKNGKSFSLGTTDASGKVSKEGLTYGGYSLTYTLPEGYTVATVNPLNITLTTANNSQNVANIVVKKVVKQPATTESSLTQTAPQQSSTPESTAPPAESSPSGSDLSNGGSSPSNTGNSSNGGQPTDIE